MERNGTAMPTTIRRARRHPEALAELLDSYRRYLWVLARGLLGAGLRAKLNPSDVVQETLLRAHERFGQFRGRTEKELLHWLRRVLTNRLADLARRYADTRARDVGREVSLALDRSASALDALVADGRGSPSRHAARRELQVKLADALAELSDDHREVIVLRNIHGMEWADVARQMGRTSGAVRVLWVRALQKLRPLIEGLR